MTLKRFPLIVAHKSDEPSYGLLTRTAGHNGTRLYPAVFAQYGIKYRYGVHNIDAGAVAASCQANLAAVAFASPVAGTKSAEIMGQVVHRDHFSTVRRRWCPECLREDPYHRAWWDIVAITCCPRHGIELEDRCGCKARDAWQTFGTTHCQKGHDMRAVAQRHVPAEDLTADRYLVARLTGRSDCDGGLLDTIAMGVAIIAMERIGQAWHDEDGGLRKARLAVGTRRLMCIGFRILTNPEAEFPKLLDNPGKRAGNWGIHKAYGQLHNWVMTLDASPFATALQEILFAHANSKVVVKTGSILAPDDRSLGYRLEEASELAGMSAGKFRRIAIEMGLIPSTGIRGRPARLNREQVHDIAVRFHGSKTRDQVADELGITYSAIMPIIEDGLLVPLMRAGQSGLNSWDFPAAAAETLLATMPAVVESESASELVPLPVAAQQARLTVSMAINMVMTGELLVRGLDATAVGLQRHMVDVSEVAQAGRRRRLPGHSKQEAAKLLGLHSNALQDYVKQGIIATVTHGKEVIITADEIARFRRDYVAVPELSEILGFRRSRETIAALARTGVQPACPRPPFWKVLYRRDEAVPAARECALSA